LLYLEEGYRENKAKGKQGLPVSSWRNGLLDGMKMVWATRLKGHSSMAQTPFGDLEVKCLRG